VSDKTGIETIGRGLVDFGFSILSTGGTANALSSAGLPVTPLSEFTGFPEILGGRVKTLHPRVYAGILARDTDAHLEDLDRIQSSFIDLVAVNLYPFERTADVPCVELFELVEQIDIGGVCLLRAAAKNFERVTVVCDPKDYETVLWHFSHDGEVPLQLRFELAIKAFNHTAAYDNAIATTLPEFEVESGRRRGNLE
jgi:phosphoribosylaminoimidazolecarboxamide formyltransferase/IMP cyclohydrolase